MNSKGSTEFVIPDSVTTVGQNAFEGASSLGNVVLGEKVSQVPTSAFKNCGSLYLAEINAKVFDCTPFSKTYTTTDTGIKFLKTATDITNTVGLCVIKHLSVDASQATRIWLIRTELCPVCCVHCRILSE